ncbi:MAG: T9SS type A sorting domain-containing protein [Candidatus Kapabacteria bacterium]|jgi:WD40 repeat protein|nr:T9SS type A sorting domain-containing protein [Candidatus Kapabacteria bacterium]
MLRFIVILTVLIVLSGKVFAGDSSDVVWQKDINTGSIGVSISPDNTMLARMNRQGAIDIYNFETGDLIKSIDGSQETEISIKCYSCLDFSHDGKYLVGAKPFFNKNSRWVLGLTVWNTNDWSIHSSYDSLANSFQSLYALSCYHNSNRVAAVVGHDLSIIDLDKKKVINTFDPMVMWATDQLEITFDDKYFITTSSRRDHSDLAGASAIIDTDTGELIKYADGFPLKTLLTKDRLNIICFYKEGITIRDYTNIYTIKYYKYDFNTVRDAKISADGQYVVATTGLGLYVFKVGFWDTPYTYDSDMIQSVYFDLSSDGQYIAFGDPLVLKPRWETVLVDETVPSERIKILYCSPNPAIINSTIKIISPETIQAEITITDISRNHISTIYSGLLTPGKNEIPIDCVSLSSGMYFCNLIAANINQSVKFVVDK